MSSAPEDRERLSRAVIRDHARSQMELRRITEDQVRQVLRDPETVVTLRPGRVVAQGMIATTDAADPAGTVKEHLLRVIVDVDRMSPELVTAYRTSKIRKYRSHP